MTNTTKAKFDRESLSPAQLQQIFTLRQRGLEKATEHLPYGPERLRAIHHQLFKDVEPEAGQFRDERVAPFLGKMQNRLEEKEMLRGASQYEVVNEITQCFSDLVKASPFKTDNKPVIRKFLMDLTAETGNAIDWSAMKPGEWNKAVKDAYKGKAQSANNMFHRIFREASPTVHGNLGIRINPKIEHGGVITGGGRAQSIIDGDRAKNIAANLKSKSPQVEKRFAKDPHP